VPACVDAVAFTPARWKVPSDVWKVYHGAVSNQSTAGIANLGGYLSGVVAHQRVPYRG